MSAMLRHPLKQSFIEYFQLNQIDNTVYHSQLHEYLVIISKLYSNENKHTRTINKIYHENVL
jgi:hypothetical protein